MQARRHFLFSISVSKIYPDFEFVLLLWDSLVNCSIQPPADSVRSSSTSLSALPKWVHGLTMSFAYLASSQVLYGYCHKLLNVPCYVCEETIKSNVGFNSKVKNFLREQTFCTVSNYSFHGRFFSSLSLP